MALPHTIDDLACASHDEAAILVVIVQYFETSWTNYTRVTAYDPFPVTISASHTPDRWISRRLTTIVSPGIIRVQSLFARCLSCAFRFGLTSYVSHLADREPVRSPDLSVRSEQKCNCPDSGHDQHHRTTFHHVLLDFENTS